MEKINAVMIGEAGQQLDSIPKQCCDDFMTRKDRRVFDESGLPLTVLKENGVNAKLEFELGKFLVRVGGDYVWGCYPYYTAEGWVTCEDYEKFYFGGLMLKLGNGDWYTAPWIDPDASEYELFEMTRADDLNAAIRCALEVAVEDYRKKTR